MDPAARVNLFPVEATCDRQRKHRAPNGESLRRTFNGLIAGWASTAQQKSGVLTFRVYVRRVFLRPSNLRFDRHRQVEPSRVIAADTSLTGAKLPRFRFCADDDCYRSWAVHLAARKFYSCGLKRLL